MTFPFPTQRVSKGYDLAMFPTSWYAGGWCVGVRRGGSFLENKQKPFIVFASKRGWWCVVFSYIYKM